MENVFLAIFAKFISHEISEAASLRKLTIIKIKKDFENFSMKIKN